MNDLPEKIKAKRLELGLKQFELAKLVGVSAPTMNDWEHGRTVPRGKNLYKLAQVLKVSAGSLLDNKISPYSDITDSEAFELLTEVIEKGLSDEVVNYLKYLANKPEK